MTLLTRREWHALTLSGVVAGTTALMSRPSRAASVGAGRNQTPRVGGVLIGVQSYSFRDRDLDGLVNGMVEIGLSSCELWGATSSHGSYEGVMPATSFDGGGQPCRWTTFAPSVGNLTTPVSNSTLTTRALKTTSLTKRLLAGSRRRTRLEYPPHVIGTCQQCPSHRRDGRPIRHAGGHAQPLTGRPQRVLQPRGL